MTTYHSNDFTNTESFKNLACMGFKVRYHCLPCIPRETVGLATWQASWHVCSNLHRQLNLTKAINKHNSKVKTDDNSVSRWSQEWGKSLLSWCQHQWTTYDSFNAWMLHLLHFYHTPACTQRYHFIVSFRPSHYRILYHMVGHHCTSFTLTPHSVECLATDCLDLYFWSVTTAAITLTEWLDWWCVQHVSGCNSWVFHKNKLIIKSPTNNDNFYFVLCNLVPIIYTQYRYLYLKVRYWYLDHLYLSLLYWYWYLFVEYLIQDCHFSSGSPYVRLYCLT